MGTIALEEHFLPAGLEDCLTGVGWDAAEWRGVVDRLIDMDLRLKEMDACGIEKAVLSLASPGVQGIASPGRATQVASQANDALARIIQRHPDRFGGFAALPMQDPAAAATELRRTVAELGMCGALVNGQIVPGRREIERQGPESSDRRWRHRRGGRRCRIDAKRRRCAGV